MQVPWDGVAETNDTLGGSMSVTVTPEASEGPWLATLSVYVSVSPRSPGRALSDLTSSRLAVRGSFTSSSTFWSAAVPSPEPKPACGSL